jgi:chorismate dehydratase
MANTRKNRLGAVTYLNTKPLIEFLPGRLPQGNRLSLDLPSHLADQLAQNELDVGLIPTIEFLRHAQSNSYRILSDACIACQGKVHSVRLFFRVPPSQVKSMAVDEGSRTSIALASILLHDRFGIHPKKHSLPIDSHPDEIEADAVLVIGDRAMHPSRYHSFNSDWDLGEQWYLETGLPFVFAMWIAHEDRSLPELAESLEEARDEGLQRVQELCEKYAANYQLSVSECHDYLTKNLQFTLTHEAIQSLNLFYRKAVELGLTPVIHNEHWMTPITAPKVITPL